MAGLPGANPSQGEGSKRAGGLLEESVERAIAGPTWSAQSHAAPTHRGHGAHKGKKGQGQQPLHTGKERHRFALNPHPDVRFTRCPLCEKPTKQRKFVLAINIQPGTLLALGFTCRYCPGDDLIIAHQDALEAEMAIGIGQRMPDLVGHDYLVLGTVERKVWRKGLHGGETPMEQAMPALHPFREMLDLPPLRWGWFPDDKR